MYRYDKAQNQYENLKADVTMDIMELLLSLPHPILKTKWGTVTIKTVPVMGKTLYVLQKHKETEAQYIPLETLIQILRSVELVLF